MLADNPDALKAIQTAYPAFAKWLKSVPVYNYWCFVIDIKDHENDDPFIYDKDEPGYLNAMLDSVQFAWQKAVEKKKITPHFIKTLHKKATHHVDNLNGDPAGYRIYEGVFGFIPPYAPYSNCTVTGLNELRKEWSHKNKHHSFVYREGLYEGYKDISNFKAVRVFNSNNLLYWGTVNTNHQDIKNKIHIAIHHYYENLKKTKTDFDKIYSIARFIHHLDVLHPFEDGNIRTFAYLLCQILLIQNGFFPVAFENPNRFDGYSSFELALMLHESLAMTAEVFNLPYPQETIEKDIETFKQPTEGLKRGREMLFHYKHPFKDPLAPSQPKKASRCFEKARNALNRRKS